MPYLPGTEKKVYYRRWDTENPKVNIVFFHGVGEHSSFYQRFAHAMNHNGYCMWAIDQIGHGGTEGSLSECYDLFSLLDNAKKLIDFARAEYPALPLVLIAHSMGGVMTSLLMSQADRPQVDGVIFSGTPLGHVDLPEDFVNDVTTDDPHFLESFDLDTLFPAEAVNFRLLEDGFDRAFRSIHPQLKSWDFPALFINGEKDPFAPPDKVPAWIKDIPDVRSFEILGGHHGLLEDWCWKVVTELMHSFIYEVTTKCVVRRPVATT